MIFVHILRCTVCTVCSISFFWGQLPNSIIQPGIITYCTSVIRLTLDPPTMLCLCCVYHQTLLDLKVEEKKQALAALEDKAQDHFDGIGAVMNTAVSFSEDDDDDDLDFEEDTNFIDGGAVCLVWLAGLMVVREVGGEPGMVCLWRFIFTSLGGYDGVKRKVKHLPRVKKNKRKEERGGARGQPGKGGESASPVFCPY